MVRISRHTYVERLRAVPMFRACSIRELEQVARLADEIVVAAGEELVREGSRGAEFYVLAEGKAEVTRGSATLAMLGPGDFFGELSLLEPGPRNATVTMVSPGRVLVLAQRQFFTLLADQPAVTTKLLVGMARRLHEADARPVR